MNASFSTVFFSVRFKFPTTVQLIVDIVNNKDPYYSIYYICIRNNSYVIFLGSLRNSYMVFIALSTIQIIVIGVGTFYRLI